MPLCLTLKKLAIAIPLAMIVVSSALCCWSAPQVVAQSIEADATGSPLQTLRLRFAWGGGQPRQWTGRLTIDGGELQGLILLGREADTPGSIVASDGGIDIYQPAARRLDGFDVTATFPANGIARLELSASNQSEPQVVLLRYEDLLDKPQRIALDDSQNVLLVHRAANDLLRVKTDRESRIFAPGEKFSFSAQLAIYPTPAESDLQLRATLVDAVGNTIAEQLPPIANLASVPLEFAMPDLPGVYRFRLSVMKPAPKSYRVPFLNNDTPQVITERVIEVVVLAKQAATFEPVAEWPVLLDLDPTSSTWAGRLPDWVWLRRLPNMPKGPAGNRAPTIVPFASGRGVQLQSSLDNQQGDWQAYPLPVLSVGTPHVVEVDVPTDKQQQIALRVFEPGADELLVPVGRGSVFYRDEPRHDPSQPNVEQLRYLFWPSTTSATLVVQTVGDRPATYSQIRLRTPKYKPLAAAFLSQAVERNSSRVRTATIDNPFWARDFLSTSVDTPSGIGDYYTATTRLADWLVLAGYDSVALPVYFQGSLLARIDGLPSTPLLCTESLDAGTNDLPSCDALQILLDVCQSRGLKISPILDFNGAIPQLESVRRGDDATVELVDHTGRRWSEHFAAAGVRRRYDPHHPLVQDAIADIVEKTTNRYGAHPAFGGVVISLDGAGSTVPAGAYWGLHQDSIKRFTHAQPLSDEDAKWLASDPLNVLRSEKLRSLWSTWRVQTTTTFYDSIQQRGTNSTDSNTLLLGHRALEDIEFTSRFRPPVGAPANLAGWIAEHGLPKSVYEQCLIERAVPPNFPPTNRFDFVASTIVDSTNRSSESQTTNGQWVGDAIEVAVPTGDNAGLLRFASDATRPVPLVAIGDADNRRLAQAISTHDSPHILVTSPCAATTLPSDFDHWKLWKQLPIDGEVSKRVQQPIWVKAVADQSQTTLVACNNSPWPIEAAITIEVARRTTAIDLANADETPLSFSSGRHIWQVAIGPHQTTALRCDAPGVTIGGIGLKQSPSYRDYLAKRIESLEQHSLNSPSDYHPLDNLSMERTSADGTLAGWTIATSGTATVKIDNSTTSDGSQSALLQSTGGVASLASDYFPNPDTGQLAVTAGVNIEQVADGATLLIIVENQAGTYRQHTELSAERLRSDASLRNWNSYTVGFEDVPFRQSDQLRLRFELRGTAALRIDAVELQPLVFPLGQYDESKQQIVALASIAQLARKRLDEGDVTSCEAILDSYWARYISRHLPKIEPASIASETSPSAAGPEAQPRRAATRLRDYLPSIFR